MSFTSNNAPAPIYGINDSKKMEEETYEADEVMNSSENLSRAESINNF